MDSPWLLPSGFSANFLRFEGLIPSSSITSSMDIVVPALDLRRARER